MKNLFNASWPTTVAAGVVLVAGTVVADPSILSFLPPDIINSIVGVCKFIAVLGVAFGFSVSKSFNVTGGNKPATHEAEKRIEEDKKTNAENI